MENLLPPKEWFIDGVKERIKEYEKSIKFFEEHNMQVHKQIEMSYRDNLIKWLNELGGNLNDDGN